MNLGKKLLGKVSQAQKEEALRASRAEKNSKTWGRQEKNNKIMGGNKKPFYLKLNKLMFLASGKIKRKLK